MATTAHRACSRAAPTKEGQATTLAGLVDTPPYSAH
jgi:hypothetical protein